VYIQYVYSTGSRRNSRAEENKDIDWGFTKVPLNAQENSKSSPKSKSKKEPELYTPQRLEALQNENLKLRRQFRDTKQQLEALKQKVSKQEKQFEELSTVSEAQMAKEVDIMNFLKTMQDTHKGRGSIEPLFDVGELPEAADIDNLQEEAAHLEKENIMLKSKLKHMNKHIQSLEEESKLYDSQLAEFKRLIADSQLSQTFTQVLQRNTLEQTNDMNDPRCDLFTMEKTKV
jgi:DNA repair exonuclease SbcCD ATPase subunit